MNAARGVFLWIKPAAGRRAITGSNAGTQTETAGVCKLDFWRHAPLPAAAAATARLAAALGDAGLWVIKSRCGKCDQFVTASAHLPQIMAPLGPKRGA